MVIPHYGSPDPALELIGDLRAQSTDRTVEIIVADDASPEPFPPVDGVRVVRRSTNGGFGSAVNAGAAVATGAIIFILNSDLRIGPDFVESLAAAQERFGPAVVGPRLVGPDGSDRYSARRFPRATHQVVEWLMPLTRLRNFELSKRAVGYDLGHGAPDATRRVDWLVGAALCVPRADFERVRGFDESFFMNCEEVDLQMRLGRSDVPSILVGDVVATHVGGASSADQVNRRRWVVAARRRYAAKWGGLTRLRVSLTAATAVNLAWNVGRSLVNDQVHPIELCREDARLIWGPPAERQPSEAPDVPDES